MRKLIGYTAMLAFALYVVGCAALTKQEKSQSNLPTAATLTGLCNAGKAQTPPIRAGACDDFDVVQSACLGLTNQPLVPAQALIACTANGYAISGNWTPL